MNIDKLKIYIDKWYENIDKDNILELERDLEMPFKEFVVQLLSNLYNKYKDSILFISVNEDNYANYVISSQDNYYSLEDFLINRLLRNISMVNYQEQFLLPDSHYDYTYGEVLIDKIRMQTQIKDVRQKRKLVAHELLHGLKTQFVGNEISRGNEYFKLKEELKKTFPKEINDFSCTNTEQNRFYSHSGLTLQEKYLKSNDMIEHYIDTEVLDEIFNEIEAMKVTHDDYKKVHNIGNDGVIILNNPESSNTYITNYAYIMERIIDDEILFIGMYINPQILFTHFNNLYNKIFQEHYNSSKNAIEILVENLNDIKKNHNNINGHVMLLDTLYDCINLRYVMSGYNDEIRDKNIGCLGNKGIMEIVAGKLQPHNKLSYVDEYNIVRNKEK